MCDHRGSCGETLNWFVMLIKYMVDVELYLFLFEIISYRRGMHYVLSLDMTYQRFVMVEVLT